MIPLLATIVSIYCVLRLIEMGYESSKKYQVPAFRLYNIYYLGAIVIVILCLVILSKADEASRALSHLK